MNGLSLDIHRQNFVSNDLKSIMNSFNPFIRIGCLIPTASSFNRVKIAYEKSLELVSFIRGFARCSTSTCVYVQKGLRVDLAKERKETRSWCTEIWVHWNKLYEITAYKTLAVKKIFVIDFDLKSLYDLGDSYTIDSDRTCYLKTKKTFSLILWNIWS